MIYHHIIEYHPTEEIIEFQYKHEDFYLLDGSLTNGIIAWICQHQGIKLPEYFRPSRPELGEHIFTHMAFTEENYNNFNEGITLEEMKNRADNKTFYYTYKG